MGRKGDKLNQDSVLVAELFTKKLHAIEGISNKKMFGGHGIFHKGNMFGIIDFQGQCYMKVDDSNKAEYEARGAHQHSRMPYFSVPDEVFNDQEELCFMGKFIHRYC
jgi:DNA transformation protein and related proteins